jgi:hypothetical protein
MTCLVKIARNSHKHCVAKTLISFCSAVGKHVWRNEAKASNKVPKISLVHKMQCGYMFRYCKCSFSVATCFEVLKSVFSVANAGSSLYAKKRTDCRRQAVRQNNLKNRSSIPKQAPFSWNLLSVAGNCTLFLFLACISSLIYSLM